MTKSILSNLKLTEKPVMHDADPIMVRRNKLLIRLQEQRLCAVAMLDGKVHEAFHEKVVEKDGEKVLSKVKKRIKHWFFVYNSNWHFEVRYANRPLELAKGKNAIVVGEAKNIVPTIDAIIQAVEAGEFDEFLKNFRKNDAE
jgi:hypothetical protein